MANPLVHWLHHHIQVDIHFSSDGKSAGTRSEVPNGAKVLWTEKLYHYAQYHFLYEEDRMSRQGFTDLPAHKDQHLQFTAKVLDFSHQSTTRRSSVNEEIVTFLKGWIVEHILAEDKKFKTEFQKAFPGKNLA